MSTDDNNNNNSNNNNNPVGSAKDEKARSTTGRKTSSAANKSNHDHQAEIPTAVPLKCPRCDSPNTKFCYYNNYSLSQPRHFCKTCRRYWTRNGALRNVPIGGGCRLNSNFINSPPPSNFNQFVSAFGDRQHMQTNSAGVNFNPVMGFHQEMGSLNVNSSIASTIESLSSMNQDLHWKLQQQRLANMFFVGENINHHQKNNGISISTTSTSSVLPADIGGPKPLQPILFQNLENISKQDHDHQSSGKEIGGIGNGNNLCTEWYFDNSYASVNPTPETSSSNNNNNNFNNNVNDITNNNNNNNNNTSSSWSTGIQAWNDLTNYTQLP
ncbi:hypothetical protein ACJIZ3_023264 [Penstemon smallii]|uniref:Dof zinc finger protein n=1 Tax=Penstemon smallii TaxID=265156 RepID=A0ABD3TQL3_9LAMI